MSANINNSLTIYSPNGNNALSRISSSEIDKNSKLPMIVRGFLDNPDSEPCRANFLEHLSTLKVTAQFMQLATDVIGEKDMPALDFYMFLVKACLDSPAAFRFETAVKDLANRQITDSKVKNLQDQIHMKDAQIGAYGRELRRNHEEVSLVRQKNEQLERQATEERQGRLADREMFLGQYAQSEARCTQSEAAHSRTQEQLNQTRAEQSQMRQYIARQQIEEQTQRMKKALNAQTAKSSVKIVAEAGLILGAAGAKLATGDLLTPFILVGVEAVAISKRSVDVKENHLETLHEINEFKRAQTNAARGLPYMPMRRQ
jgi:hypothetical protein